jgi:hypothetical protein
MPANITSQSAFSSAFELELIEYSKATLYDPAKRVYSLITNIIITRQCSLTDMRHASSLSFLYDVNNKMVNKLVGLGNGVNLS